MFCMKCGSKLEDGLKFCTKCGAAAEGTKRENGFQSAKDLSDTAPADRGCMDKQKLSQREVSPKVSKKKSKKKMWIVIVAATVIFALCAGVLVTAQICLESNHGNENREDIYESTSSMANEVHTSVYYMADTVLQTQICTDDFLNADQQERKEIAENVLYKLEEQGELKEGSITYSEELEVFYYCYADGAEGAVMLRDFSSELSGSNNLGFEVEYTPYDSALYDGISEELAENGLEIIYGKRSGIIVNCLGDTNEQGVIGVDNGVNITRALFLEYEAEAWTANGFETEYVRNCTVEDFKTLLKGKGLIDIQCHGFLDVSGNPTICISNNSGIWEYEADRNAGRVGALYSTSGETYYLTDDFIRYYYSDGLTESIVWLGCCSGYRNDTLVSAFADCGAKAVLGATESVLTSYDLWMTDAFAYWLMYGYTVDEALTLAKDAYGKNDRIWYSGKAEEDGTAEIRYYNGGEETLVVLGYMDTTGEARIIVTDEDGNRLSTAEVLLDDNDGPGNTVYHYSGETDEEGVFSVPLCEAGWYTVSVTLDGYAAHRGEIQIIRHETNEMVIVMKSGQADFTEKLSELISEYGVFDANQSGTMNAADDEWLEPTGIMSATILDFDMDGLDEMMVCIAEAAEKCGNACMGNEDAYHIVMYMYEAEKGEIQKADRMVLAAYKEAEGDEIEYVDVDLWKNCCYTGMIAANVVLVDESCYIVCERDMWVGTFADGGRLDYWILEYVEGKFQYAGAFTQRADGSCDFEYDGYIFEDGICIESDVYIAPTEYSWIDLSPLYSNLGEAIVAFFGNYNVQVDSSNVYSHNIILTSENNMILLFEFANKNTASDYQNNCHSFSATLSRGNELLGILEGNGQNKEEEPINEEKESANENKYDGTISMYFKGTWIKDDMVYIFTPNSNTFSVSYAGGIEAAGGDLVILDMKKRDAIYGSYTIIDTSQVNLVYSLSNHVVNYVYTDSTLTLDGEVYAWVDDAVVHQLEGEWVGDDITLTFNNGTFEKRETDKTKETGRYYVVSADTIVAHVNGNTSMSIWSYSLDHLTMIYGSDTVLTKKGNDSSAEKIHEIEEQLYGAWTEDYFFYEDNVCMYMNVFVYTYRVLDEETVCIYTQPPEEFAYTLLTYDEEKHTLTMEDSLTSNGDKVVLYQE